MNRNGAVDVGITPMTKQSPMKSQGSAISVLDIRDLQLESAKKTPKKTPIGLRLQQQPSINVSDLEQGNVRASSNISPSHLITMKS